MHSITSTDVCPSHPQFVSHDERRCPSLSLDTCASAADPARLSGAAGASLRRPDTQQPDELWGMDASRLWTQVDGWC